MDRSALAFDGERAPFALGQLHSDALYSSRVY